ncbi:MAG: BspA family leucine-rich repeat surface protein [Bacteroidota bacterium]
MRATSRFFFLILILVSVYNTRATQAQSDPFITTWIITEPGDTVRFQTLGGPDRLRYNTVVDWGDGVSGQVFFGDAPDIFHVYATADTFQIEIRATFPALIREEDAPDDPRLVSIDAWGDREWEVLTNAFSNYPNLVVNATDAPDLRRASSLEGLFSGSGTTAPDSTSDWDLSNWDVRTITRMDRMFKGADKFNGDVSTWDVSSVTSFVQMFGGAEQFNGDISSWNVSSAQTMDEMFSGALVFNQDLNNWNVSGVRSFNRMFGGARAFNGNIADWNVIGARDMHQMFAGARWFNQDIGSWDVRNVTDMSFMFLNTAFNQDIGGWDMSSVTTIRGMFQAARSFNQDIGDWVVSSVTNMNNVFNSATRFDQDISGWDVSSVEQMSLMFGGGVFNQDISGWNVSNVLVMSSMFSAARQFNQNLADWNISSVVNMNRIFDRVQLSSANYDSILISWSAQQVQSGIQFDGGLSRYTVAAASARQQLIDNAGWSIVDRGLLTPQKVAEYSFDDGTAMDRTGNGNNGVITGATPGVDRFGNANQAMQFDGIDDFINFGDSVAFRFGVEDFSISFWFNYTGTNPGFILGKRGTNGNRNRYEFSVNPSSTDQISLNTTDQFGRIGTQSTLDIIQGRWEHIVYIHDAENSERYFLNGEQVINRSFSGDSLRGFDVLQGPFMIGNSNPFAREFFQGLVDDVSIYTYALTEQEVDMLWGGFRATSNEEPGSATPVSFNLEQNYPNPFNPTTTITYSIPQPSEVNLAVFNALGQRVASLVVNERKSIGTHSVVFDASSLASGMYIYRITAGNYTQTRKFMLIK